MAARGDGCSGISSESSEDTSLQARGLYRSGATLVLLALLFPAFIPLSLLRRADVFATVVGTGTTSEDTVDGAAMAPLLPLAASTSVATCVGVVDG